jgi:hypothetical protein
MPPSNRIVLASAGAGKTTEIVTEALSMCPRKVAITTFTLRNVEEIKRKIIELSGFMPPEITIYPWYTFVLHEMVRPYQGCASRSRPNPNLPATQLGCDGSKPLPCQSAPQVAQLSRDERNRPHKLR